MTVGFWQQRHEIEPVVTDRTVHDSWANGRDSYLTFVVDITEESVVDALAETTESLTAFNCIRPAPPKYFHITLKQVGFVVGTAKAHDEVSSATADAIAKQAVDVISKVESFSVRLPRLNIYPSVVFCEIHDEGHLETLHRHLMELPKVPEFQYDGDGYGPHITLAQFQETSDFGDLLQWLERNREVSVGSVQIEAISLIEVNPHSFFPEFRTIRQYSSGDE